MSAALGGEAGGEWGQASCDVEAPARWEPRSGSSASYPIRLLLPHSPHTLLLASVRPPGLGAAEWRPFLADYTAVSRGFSGTWPLGSGSWRVIEFPTPPPNTPEGMWGPRTRHRHSHPRPKAASPEKSGQAHSLGEESVWGLLRPQRPSWEGTKCDLP